MASITSPSPFPSPDPGAAVAEELLPEATRRLIRTADALADEEYAAPSALPGWTRAHVLAHLALNAEGLAGALMGIVEGEPVPMYASPERRDSDIDDLAACEPSAIRTRLLGGCTDIVEAIAAVPAAGWDTVIERTPGSQRTVRASEVPAMRLREVEIHHADLAAGYDCADWPPGFAAHLLDAMLTRHPATTPLHVQATDLDRTWTFGEGGPTVSGTAADLGWWLTGRGTGQRLTSDDGRLPGIEAM